MKRGNSSLSQGLEVSKKIKPSISKQSSPKQSSPKQSSPKQSSPKQSSPKQSSPKPSTPKQDFSFILSNLPEEVYEYLATYIPSKQDQGVLQQISKKFIPFVTTKQHFLKNIYQYHQLTKLEDKKRAYGEIRQYLKHLPIDLKNGLVRIEDLIYIFTDDIPLETFRDLILLEIEDLDILKQILMKYLHYGYEFEIQMLLKGNVNMKNDAIKVICKDLRKKDKGLLTEKINVFKKWISYRPIDKKLSDYLNILSNC